MSSLQGEGATGPADDRPLTDQEYQLLQRLLSDPFSLPIQFKTWLIAYLESSDLTLPMSAILGLQSTLGITGAGQGTLGVFPAGLILPFGGGGAPTGSKLCDGASYLRTTETRLFAAIGTTYGADDAGSFKVPDLRGRVIVGVGPHADVAGVGLNEGAAVADRRPKHSHSHTLAQEYSVHFFLTDPGSTDAGGDSFPIFPSGSGTDGAIPSVGTVGPAGASADAPAFMALNFIIVS